MKYSKAEAEVILFDEFLEFMTGSMIDGHCTDYTAETGEHCGDYRINVHCSSYVFRGDHDCGNYDGNVCRGYSNPPWINNCRTYYPWDSCTNF